MIVLVTTTELPTSELLELMKWSLRIKTVGLYTLNELSTFKVSNQNCCPVV